MGYNEAILNAYNNLANIHRLYSNNEQAIALFTSCFQFNQLKSEKSTANYFITNNWYFDDSFWPACIFISFQKNLTKIIQSERGIDDERRGSGKSAEVESADLALRPQNEPSFYFQFPLFGSVFCNETEYGMGS